MHNDHTLTAISSPTVQRGSGTSVGTVEVGLTREKVDYNLQHVKTCSNRTWSYKRIVSSHDERSHNMSLAHAGATCSLASTVLNTTGFQRWIFEPRNMPRCRHGSGSISRCLRWLIPLHPMMVTSWSTINTATPLSQDEPGPGGIMDTMDTVYIKLANEIHKFLKSTQFDQVINRFSWIPWVDTLHCRNASRFSDHVAVKNPSTYVFCLRSISEYSLFHSWVEIREKLDGELPNMANHTATQDPRVFAWM